MLPREVEEDIVNDLTELDDPESQYSYLLACGRELSPLPEEYRIPENEIPECQVHTWAKAFIKDGKTYFYADSESIIVKGVLSFLEEIYQERDVSELKDYKCGLLDYEIIKKYYNDHQLAGLHKVVQALFLLIVSKKYNN